MPCVEVTSSDTLAFLLVLHLEGCGLRLPQSACHQAGRVCLRMTLAEEAKLRNAAKHWV